MVNWENKKIVLCKDGKWESFKIVARVYREKKLHYINLHIKIRKDSPRLKAGDSHSVSIALYKIFGKKAKWIWAETGYGIISYSKAKDYLKRETYPNRIPHYKC